VTIRKDRSRSRRCAMQALYQWQLTRGSASGIVSEFLEDRDLAAADVGHFRNLLQGVVAHCEDLDRRLEPLLDRPLRQLDPVARGILYIGLYELLHCPDIPWRVALAESVKLAKAFGGEDSYKYVNGVLDRAARDLGRAGPAASG